MPLPQQDESRRSKSPGGTWGGKVTSQCEARVTPRSQSTAGHHSSSNARGNTSTSAGERVLPGVFIDLPEGSEVADRTFPLQQLIPVGLDQGTVDFSA